MLLLNLNESNVSEQNLGNRELIFTLSSWRYQHRLEVIVPCFAPRPFPTPAAAAGT
jgi:hypothetical protein